MKLLILMVFFMSVIAYDAIAAPDYSCEQVRAYVGQVGRAQATSDARAQGMTAGQENRARHCLVRRKHK